MSMSLATRVDVGADRPDLRWESTSALPRRPTVMTPIAAYYVMIATEHERIDRTPRHQVAPPRRSLIERIAAGLESLLNLGRPTTTQPI
jgi:hypothetical protein